MADEEKDISQMTQEEAIRELFNRRMKRTQEIQQQQPQQQQQQNPHEVPDRCPHGVPLARSCRKCDVVTDADIKDRIPVN